MAELVAPNQQYKDSFIEAVREYQEEKLPLYMKLDSQALETDFENQLKILDEQTGGENFWLVNENEFIGRVSVRRELTDQLRLIGGNIGYDIRPSQRKKGYGKLSLQLGLEKAKQLGFSQVLLTCDIDNKPSNKIIQDNGGVLSDVQPVGPERVMKNHYWITL